MDKAKAIANIEREAVELRLEMHQLYKRAGVTRMTWYRARKNPESMTLTTLGNMERALRERRAEMDPASVKPARRARKVASAA